MAHYSERISELSEDLDVFMEDYEEDAPETRDEEIVFMQEGFLDKLSDIIDAVRDAQAAGCNGLENLIKQADRTISNAIIWAHQGDPMGPYSESHMPSFAHNEHAAPLLIDGHKEGEFSHGFAGTIAVRGLESLLRALGSDRSLAEIKADMKSKLPQAWKKTLRPHPLSTTCSRFRDDIPEWRATETNSRATAVFEARCEISSGDIPYPLGLRLSSNGNIIAVASMGGYKNRTPYIYYYLPNQEEDPHGEFMKTHVIKADLVSTVDDLLLDDQRKLIFAADWKRVKSYQCDDPTGTGRKAKRVHTLDSENYAGPLAMLPNGRLLRAGKEAVAVWDLKSLSTHGVTGKDIIGSKLDAEDMDTWRDDPESIEPSSGSKPTTTISLDVGDGEDADGFVINIWHPHPSQANTMLSATDPESEKYSCGAIDLEFGGKTTMRFLGHGGSVDGFSTSNVDPNIFLTWSGDGHARLFDVRQVLPVLTIASSEHPEPLPAAVLAHPDGVPFVFVGADSSQHIKLWDIRSQQSVYELAIGNNSVEGMAWDAASNTLYASTSCDYIDRNGRHTGYRRARIPRRTTVEQEEDVDEFDESEEEDEDEDEENEPGDDDICWPQRAHYAENYFGHVFDAGDHRFYKFSFKTDPNPEILPYYGSGSMSRGDFW